MIDAAYLKTIKTKQNNNINNNNKKEATEETSSDRASGIGEKMEMSETVTTRHSHNDREVTMRGHRFGTVTGVADVTGGPQVQYTSYVVQVLPMLIDVADVADVG
jgi:hypothetical protein